jgi:PPOX class F420-dependent enzyme/OxyR family protein
MSVFTPDEIEYLTSQTLARLATVGPDGRPHLIPVTFTFNDEEDAIDVGGIAFAKGKKWRDASQTSRARTLRDAHERPLGWLRGSNVTRAPGAAGSVRQRSAASAA